MKPHRLDRHSPFARNLLAAGGVQPCRNVHRDDFAAVRGMLVGVGIVLTVFVLSVRHFAWGM